MQFKKPVMTSTKRSLNLGKMILLAIILSGCAHVTFTDQPLCGDKGELGASCVHTLHNQVDANNKVIVKKVEKTDWDTMRFGWICMPSTAYAEAKKNSEQLCKSSGLCNFDKDMNGFFTAVEAVNK